MTWAVIGAGNAWVSGPHDEEPAPGEGERVIMVALGFPETCAWSAERGGFVDFVVSSPLISVGRFKLLFTGAERIAIKAAAAANPVVEDFLDLLTGFTDGVSLSDPFLVESVQLLAASGLIEVDRAPAILAGTPPA